MELSRMRSYRGFLAAPFRSGSHFVFSRLPLVMALSKLLLNLLGHNINRRVKVSFDILSKKVRTRQRNSHRARKLPIRCLGLVVVESDANIGRVLIQMIQLIDPGEEVIFDCSGERHIMWHKNQFHLVSMHQSERKSSERVSADLG
jgi:hypothetical protein